MKRDACTCPKCGEEIDTESVDTEWDYQCLCQKMVCGKCEHTWREYFVIQYDGYADDSGVYGADGVKEFD